MKERPILFSAPMVRAILEGRKTQTRRVIVPQPGGTAKIAEFFSPELFPLLSKKPWWISSDIGHAHCWEYSCPYGRFGDQLWVRETWNAMVMDRNDGKYKWISDIPAKNRKCIVQSVVYRSNENQDDEPYPWIPSIFMFRWASRITLEITSVRVERVQDIGEDDAIAEGISGGDWLGDPVGEYRKLWDSINAKRGFSWEWNPWVWVLEFTKVTP